MIEHMMGPDEFITTYADNDEQKEFFNSLNNEHKEHVRTFMTAYVGYGSYLLLMSLKESVSDDSSSIDEELRKLMNQN